MRKLALVIAVGIVVMVAWLCGRNSMSRAADVKPPVRQAWEYREVEFNTDTHEINELGKDGWELCESCQAKGP